MRGAPERLSAVTCRGIAPDVGETRRFQSFRFHGLTDRLPMRGAVEVPARHARGERADDESHRPAAPGVETCIRVRHPEMIRAISQAWAKQTRSWLSGIQALPAPRTCVFARQTRPRHATPRHARLKVLLDELVPDPISCSISASAKAAGQPQGIGGTAYLLRLPSGYFHLRCSSRYERIKRA